MFEEFTIGGIIGGAADLVVSSMAGKKAVRDKQMEEEGLRAEEKKEQLILQKKVCFFHYMLRLLFLSRHWIIYTLQDAFFYNIQYFQSILLFVEN